MQNIIIILLLIVIVYLIILLNKRGKALQVRNKDDIDRAVRASKASTMGKSMEQIIPYFPEFEYNPSDVRFLGSPIDLVVFDGLSEGDLREVVFVEVKTGKSAALPAREKQVRDCILAGNVRWEKLHAKVVEGETQFLISNQ
ncbi:Holliday junction resolvase-like protein [Limibacter armeniacum]|uniref:Holliday junction resolvase-like protein n=1 Tax=Limibacter armeniacum TaxID=466084 RepID=UPI002FE5CA29